MKNKINQFKTYIKVAIGTILMVALTVGGNHVFHTSLKNQDLKMAEAVDEILKSQQWYYIENSLAVYQIQECC